MEKRISRKQLFYMLHKLNIKSLKKTLKRVCKCCLVTVRKGCSVNSLVKRSVIYPYLYCLLIFVYEKSRISVKPPYVHNLSPFTDRPCGPGSIWTSRSYCINMQSKFSFILFNKINSKILACILWRMCIIMAW